MNGVGGTQLTRKKGKKKKKNFPSVDIFNCNKVGHSYFFFWVMKHTDLQHPDWGFCYGAVARVKKWQFPKAHYIMQVDNGMKRVVWNDNTTISFYVFISFYFTLFFIVFYFILYFIPFYFTFFFILFYIFFISCISCLEYVFFSSCFLKDISEIFVCL